MKFSIADVDYEVRWHHIHNSTNDSRRVRTDCYLSEVIPGNTGRSRYRTIATGTCRNNPKMDIFDKREGRKRSLARALKSATVSYLPCVRFKRDRQVIWNAFDLNYGKGK